LVVGLSGEPAMPARNLYHDAVLRALMADGWTITDDPLKLEYGDRNPYVDLGAENATVGAEKSGRKIGRDPKRPRIVAPTGPGRSRWSVSGLSSRPVRDPTRVTQPDRQLYLAAPLRTHETLLTEKLGQLVVARLGVHLHIFDDQSERVHQWIESNDTGRS
jgi:hypothetical protein